MESTQRALQSPVVLGQYHRPPEEAFDRLRREIEAVPPGELEPVNLDVRAVVMTVLGVWAKIGPLRKAMRCLPLDQSAIDQLPEYAQALAHAQALYKIQAVPPNILAEKARLARTLRDLLFSDASALVKRGVFDGRALGSMKRTTGYGRVGFDLLALTTLFRANWPRVVHRTMVTLGELADAERLGSELVALVGCRAQASRQLEANARLRAQACTLVIRAYSELRQGVSFLRWKAGDAEEFAPSLFSRRAGTRRRSMPPVEVPTAVPENPVAASTVAPVTPPCPVGIPSVGSPELPIPWASAPIELPAAALPRVGPSFVPATPSESVAVAVPLAPRPIPALKLPPPKKSTRRGGKQGKPKRPGGELHRQ